jgi:hypothetical protein
MKKGYNAKIDRIVTGAKTLTPPDGDNEILQHSLDIDSQNDEEDLPQNDDSDVSRSQNDELPSPQTGRQKAVASVNQVYPPEMIAKLTAGLKKISRKVVEDVRSHYAVPAEEQPDGILSDELRVGMKRAAAAIPRSEFEIYTFSTRHNLSEAATDELLQLVSNVSIFRGC